MRGGVAADEAVNIFTDAGALTEGGPVVGVGAHPTGMIASAILLKWAGVIF